MRSVVLFIGLLFLPYAAGAACRADFNGSGAVEINVVISVVNEALEGCSGAATPTKRVTPTRTPTTPPAASCPYKFNQAVSADRFCGYSGPTTSGRCGDLLPSDSGWFTDGTDIYAILVDETGSLAVIGTRTNPTTARVNSVSPGPDYEDVYDATGTISLPSTTRLTVTFDAGVECGTLTHMGTFESLLGSNAIGAQAGAAGIASLTAELTQQAAPAGITSDRATVLRRLVQNLRR
jgi:hypothetical protein